MSMQRKSQLRSIFLQKGVDDSAPPAYNFLRTKCRGGGIGRHARLRGVWGNPYEFKSRLRHHFADLERPISGLSSFLPNLCHASQTGIKHYLLAKATRQRFASFKIKYRQTNKYLEAATGCSVCSAACRRAEKLTDRPAHWALSFALTLFLQITSVKTAGRVGFSP